MPVSDVFVNLHCISWIVLGLRFGYVYLIDNLICFVFDLITVDIFCLWFIARLFVALTCCRCFCLFRVWVCLFCFVFGCLGWFRFVVLVIVLWLLLFMFGLAVLDFLIDVY